MAKKTHLRILNKGVSAWNEWKKKRRPNFTADLSGASLRGYDLYEADLSWADLRGTDLSEARLVGVDFFGSDLARANLTKAKLTDSRVWHANLRFANMTETILWRTSFDTADLDGAIFTRAKIGATIFGNVDLSTVIDLESAGHRWPSVIGIDTVYLSRGKIPERFLRGAGVPEGFIVYMRSLTGEPFDFYSCFISYSSKDQAFAERLHADLQSNGVRCWFAPEDLKIGDKTRLAIDESIRVYDKLLLILSKHSVTSNWVEHEVETALAREQERKRTMLFPIRLDDAVIEIKTGWPAHIKNTRHIGDFRHWKDHDAYQESFARLLRDLKASEAMKP